MQGLKRDAGKGFVGLADICAVVVARFLKIHIIVSECPPAILIGHRQKHLVKTFLF